MGVLRCVSSMHVFSPLAVAAAALMLRLAWPVVDPTAPTPSASAASFSLVDTLFSLLRLTPSVFAIWYIYEMHPRHSTSVLPTTYERRRSSGSSASSSANAAADRNDDLYAVSITATLAASILTLDGAALWQLAATYAYVNQPPWNPYSGDICWLYTIIYAKMVAATIGAAAVLSLVWWRVLGRQLAVVVPLLQRDGVGRRKRASTSDVEMSGDDALRV